MTSISNFLWKHKIDFFLLVIIAVLFFFVWHLLSQIAIRSDGYVYMLSTEQTKFWKIPLFFTGIDTESFMLGNILLRLFSFHVSYYLWFELLVVFVTDVLFYISTLLLTKKRFIAFVATIIFAFSFFGNFDMLSNHCYCFFLGRLFNMLFLIPSFIFLHLFLEKKKIKYYNFSYALYFIGLGVAHFMVLFTAPFLFYPIFWEFFQKSKHLKRGIITGFSYLMTSAFFVGIQQINDSRFKLPWGFSEFLLDPVKYKYFEKVFSQLIYWSQYPFLLKVGVDPLHQIISARDALSLAPIVVTFYVVAAAFIYKKIPQYRSLLFTTVFGTLAIFYLNAYFNQYDMLSQSSSNRYLYFPTFPLAIFWSLFLWALFKTKKTFIFAIILLLAGYFMLNKVLIGESLKYIIEQDKPTIKIIQYIVDFRNNLDKNTLVVVSFPDFGPQEATFFSDQLGKKEVKYVIDNPNYGTNWELLATESARVVKVAYSKSCHCVKEEKIK